MMHFGWLGNHLLIVRQCRIRQQGRRRLITQDSNFPTSPKSRAVPMSWHGCHAYSAPTSPRSSSNRRDREVVQALSARTPRSRPHRSVKEEPGNHSNQATVLPDGNACAPASFRSPRFPRKSLPVRRARSAGSLREWRSASSRVRHFRPSPTRTSPTRT